VDASGARRDGQGTVSPSLRQTNAKGRPSGRPFAFLTFVIHPAPVAVRETMERGMRTPDRGFDGFARSESGQPNGCPWSASARKGWVHGCTQQSQ